MAQVFVADDEWHDTLAGDRACLRPGGWFVFETRRPEARDWENWHVAPSALTLADGRRIVVARTVTEVALPLVGFESVTTVDGVDLVSASTLRFRSRAEVEDDLAAHSFETVDVREAADRPGTELVVLARCRRS